MLRIVGNQIYLTRGDTAHIPIDIVNPRHQRRYDLQPNDVLRFTVRKKTDSPIVIEKIAIGVSYVVMEPSDTETLETGSYVYDVELTMENGAIHTVIPKALFQVCDEVTYYD